MRSRNLQLGLNSFWQERGGGEGRPHSAGAPCCPSPARSDPKSGAGGHPGSSPLRGCHPRQGAAGHSLGNQDPAPGRLVPAGLGPPAPALPCASDPGVVPPGRQRPTYRPVEPPPLVHGQVEAGVHRPDGHNADTHRPDLDDACGTGKRGELGRDGPPPRGALPPHWVCGHKVPPPPPLREGWNR